MFLSLGWANSAIRIKRINIYINEHIESKLEGGGWGRYLDAKTRDNKRSMNVFYARGAFIGTQLVALFLAIPQLSFSQIELLFIAADLVAMFAVVYLTRPNRPAFL
jgi:hypothetical protein